MAKTKLTPKLEAEVDGVGNIGYLEVPFDQAVRTFGRTKILTAESLAQGRIQNGKRSSLSTNGSYAREGVVYVPGEGKILTRKSPALVSLKEAERATQSHSQGKEFSITSKKAGEYLEKAKDQKDKSAILLTDTGAVPTNRFGEDERTVWLFGKQAESYGDFLQNAGITGMQSYLSDENSQEEPFANQLWLSSLDDRSDFVGVGRVLSFSGRVRGVFSVGEADARSPKAKSEPLTKHYTARQVDRNITIVNKIRQGDWPASKLEQVAKFLENLTNN